ncbi:MAG: hypothetical protein EAZ55_03305 [Cytophagales bacterium]|nr:MAG: hypothetical protein EAZ55_03305 [Cytophagales bacterium]
MWIIVVPAMKFADGMALYPFILVRHREMKKNETLIRHERIHLRQQLELLVVPFYCFYLFNYFFNLIRYQNHHTAYRNICFEREAYENEHKIDFLQKRSFWNFIKYL